ncbi:MAG TPA: hypothetical protein VMA36_09650 [Candidatus Limnocylindria bacterium]|jgi:hypothetical protein|nr:hypothetical protein [Candidatus Limnocylindria bacterium]
MIARRHLASGLLVGLAVPLLAAAPTPAPSPSPVATPAMGAAASIPSPELAAKARVEFDAWQHGKVDLNRYLPAVRRQFDAMTVTDVSTHVLAPLGSLTSFTQIRRTTFQGMSLYVFRAVCANGAVDQMISWDDAGRVIFILFRRPDA